LKKIVLLLNFRIPVHTQKQYLDYSNCRYIKQLQSKGKDKENTEKLKGLYVVGLQSLNISWFYDKIYLKYLLSHIESVISFNVFKS